MRVRPFHSRAFLIRLLVLLSYSSDLFSTVSLLSSPKHASFSNIHSPQVLCNVQNNMTRSLNEGYGIRDIHLHLSLVSH